MPPTTSPATPPAEEKDQLLRMGIVLGSGKPAAISVPRDLDAMDALFLVKAVLDIYAKLLAAQVEGKPVPALMIPNRGLVLPD